MNADGEAWMSGLEHWETCYQQKETPWDKGAPSPGLVDFLMEHPDLEHAVVCVPGCGLGSDVLAWASAGHQATGIDIAPTGVAMAKERASAHPHACNFRIGNFLTDHPPAPVDWVFEHTFYCALQPELRQHYLEAMCRWIRPGGYLLAVHYLIPDEDGPPFGTTREEVLERFSPQFELLQDWIPRSYPNRTGLERMFWWRKPIK
ncbi:TPMT family class I SAM-dependent methyltransferase [Verrucomicrobia bacterium]|nr:TPMT family class I SAM-dependent methyltransferase [Verrucomicrobiota bacterium]